MQSINLLDSANQVILDRLGLHFCCLLARDRLVIDNIPGIGKTTLKALALF
jgi:hypothetical protein